MRFAFEVGVHIYVPTSRSVEYDPECCLLMRTNGERKILEIFLQRRTSVAFFRGRASGWIRLGVIDAGNIAY
jgi:hypothetical protein